MLRATSRISLVVLLALFIAALPLSNQSSQASKVTPRPAGKPSDLSTASAISALLAANDGKPPATGDQLWKSLCKLGNFAQLPIVYSAAKLDSTLTNPRVVIAHLPSKLSRADANQPNLVGRLFFAANMEKGPNGGDPRVISVEFISWNSTLRRFDFGVIENMGSDSKPELHIVDGGRCFACHKNRGPILGEAPWTNSTLHSGIRSLVAEKLNMAGAVPGGAPAAARNRIDGMALVSPEAVAVDAAVGIGRRLRIYRETFRLMNRSPAGKQAFLALLEGILEPGELNNNNVEIKSRVNAWSSDGADSFFHFENDLRQLLKSTNTGVLVDFAPFTSGLPNGRLWGSWPREPSWGASSGVRTLNDALQLQTKALRDNLRNAAFQNAKMKVVLEYDKARSQGYHDMPSEALPSNPKAFSTKVPSLPRTPSGMVNTFMLAGAIGLTDGDREFMIEALAGAPRQLSKKVSAKTLAREIFAGPEFADVLAGGPLPDRDDFKDRFVAGLDHLLKTKYSNNEGFHRDRSKYAYGPRHDRNAAEEMEAVIVPTTACLRCHDVRASGKARMFESIPALAFDPLDKQARDLWMKSATNERKQQVLTRIQVRLYRDADMPPRDSPEHELFRVKNAAAFDELKTFVETELAKAKKQ